MAFVDGDGSSSCKFPPYPAYRSISDLVSEGAATVGVGLFCVFFLPEYPYNARMLKPVERDLAVWRLEREAGASEANEDIGTLKGFLLGLKDPKLYVIIFMNMMSQVQGSIANFFPSIVNTLGYDHYDTLLLTAPPYGKSAQPQGSTCRS